MASLNCPQIAHRQGQEGWAEAGRSGRAGGTSGAATPLPRAFHSSAWVRSTCVCDRNAYRPSAHCGAGVEGGGGAAARHGTSRSHIEARGDAFLLMQCATRQASAPRRGQRNHGPGFVRGLNKHDGRRWWAQSISVPTAVVRRACDEFREGVNCEPSLLPSRDGFLARRTNARGTGPCPCTPPRRAWSSHPTLSTTDSATASTATTGH